MRITPLAPRAPYKAVAVASFRMEKLAGGDIIYLQVGQVARGVASAPSISIRRIFFITKSGVTPRIKKLALLLPGSPERWYAIRPATRPASAVVRLLEGTFNSCGLMEVTEPTTSAFFCLPKATTTVYQGDW